MPDYSHQLVTEWLKLELQRDTIHEIYADNKPMEDSVTDYLALISVRIVEIREILWRNK